MTYQKKNRNRRNKWFARGLMCMHVNQVEVWLCMGVGDWRYMHARSWLWSDQVCGADGMRKVA